MEDTKILALYKALEIKERDGYGSQKFKYVSSADVIDRMNRIFDGCWHSSVVHQEIIEDQAIVRVRVTVYDEKTGREFSHEGYGGSAVARFTSGMKKGQPIDLANTFKSAEAKAIKNACSRWGVGLYLEAQDIEDFVSSTDDSGDTAQVKRVQTPAFAASLPPTTPAKPTTSTAPPDSFPSFGSNTADDKPTVTKTATSLPPFASNSGGSNKSAATLPPFGNPVATPNNGGDLPKLFQSVASPPINNNNGVTETSKITDIQKAAIENIMEIKMGNSMTYSEMASKALEIDSEADVPTIDNLSYTEAVKIINYGNNSVKRK